MDIVCAYLTITFYPNRYPDAASPMILLSTGDLIDAASPILADLSQEVDTVQYVRGEVADFFGRGGKQLQLQWTEVRQIASPGGALAESLARQEAMPGSTGWALLQIPSHGQAWVIAPVAFRSHRTSYDLSKKSMRLSWDLAAGSLTEIATTAEDAALITEIGVEILTEDGGNYLALEEAV